MSVLRSFGDETVEKCQSFQEEMQENNPAMESSIYQEAELFVNSLLDHDFLRDWVDGDGGSETPVLISLREVELNPMEGVEMKMDAVTVERMEKECLKLDITGEVGQEENSEMEMRGNLGNLLCLNEEEMGKVNLDKVPIGPVSKVFCVSAIQSVDLDVAKEIGDQVVSKNHDQESDGGESYSDSDDGSEREISSSSSSSSSSSDEEEEGQDGCDQPVNDDGNSAKNDDHESDGDKSYNDSESADGSESYDEAVRSKNEITDLPPVITGNVTLQPHHETLPVGVVLWIIDSIVVIEGNVAHYPLNEGSILWITENRSPLGFIDEIFGKVNSPHYIVRYNSKSEIPTGVQPGTLVSFVPEFATHALNDKSIYEKGSDASGTNDEPVLIEEDFSDDQKVKKHKRRMRKKNFQMAKNLCRERNQSAAGAANPRVPLWQDDYQSSLGQPGMVLVLVGGSNWIPFQSDVAAANSQEPFGHGNDQRSSNQRHGLTGNPGMTPRFAETIPTNNMPADGNNVIPFQNQWMPMYLPQQMYQMPSPGGKKY